MRKYEVMLIIDPSVDERQVPSIMERHLNVVLDAGGVIDNQDVWGKRRLAYEIDKKSEGIYVVVNLTCDSDTVREFDRLTRIDERIMRSKVMRTDVK